MERRFVVEAKTTSFSAKKGNVVIRLEEKKEGVRWVHFAGDQELRLVGRRNGGGDGGSTE
jgi:hypothetical protein